MNVNELLDTIEDTLEESTSMPLSGGKRLVDVEKVRDYLDDIRANLPGELRQAQQIVNDRAQIVDTANAQAQAIVKKAEERARRRDHRRCPERVAHAASDRDRLLRQHAQDHGRGDGGECRTGKERARQPAPERQEKRLISTQITHMAK